MKFSLQSGPVFSLQREESIFVYENLNAKLTCNNMMKVFVV